MPGLRKGDNMTEDMQGSYILIPIPDGWYKYRWLGEVMVGINQLLDKYYLDHDKPMFEAIEKARQAVSRAQIVEDF